jgi:hypothetical protein
VIVSVEGKSLTVKPDSGAQVTITVGDGARIAQAAPDAKTLAGATPIQVTDLAVGDRVLIALHPAPDGSGTVATTVIAMKQADLAKKQQAEQSDWQRRGVGGVVKSVDAAASTVTIASGSRMVTIHVTPKTVVRRYDPASIKFSDAKVSTLDQIHIGDQMQARGDRSADCSELQAEEIVAGSFRNIAGTVVAADSAANTITVTDLATKKLVVLHFTPATQLHKLPAAMAQGLAVRFKAAGSSRSEGGPPAGSSAATPSSPPEGGAPGNHPGYGTAGGGAGQRSGDLSQMLQRAPVIQLSDLHKGDAVMIVATQGTSDALTAVTLLAGVEPILTASASQNMFSASWNLGGGASAGSEGAP